MKDTEIAVIIPARYNSSRLPGKPLALIAGQALILHVVERARMIRSASKIIVATDDRRIAEQVESAGGQAVMTPADLHSGSDRVGWVARDLTSDIIVNLQGDEPLVDVKAIENALHALQNNSDLQVATLGYPVQEMEDWNNPNIVKVLTNQLGNALYFSRRPIPFFRDEEFKPIPNLFYHIGVYLYRREFLLKYLSWKPTVLERVEKLEQLRILENGYSMKVVPANYRSIGVDTPEDLGKMNTEFLKMRENLE